MLNLIQDAWIPVRRKDGSRAVIAPWQMADDTLAFPDWPRPDLNIACLELLIGLVFLADPPRDAEDWQDRRAPDPDRLRARLAPFAPAFELMGEGPRFCQDLERLEDAPGATVAPAARLFIDSGGEITEKKNADLFVKRDRYDSLDPAMAAMALFTTQIYAYADSSKHRSSLRDNGPLVTLVDPLHDGRPAGLWPLVWANVPDGSPSDSSGNALPWLRPTVVSGDRGRTVPWPGKHVPETFFSMPWRMRLVAEGDRIIGFVRKDFGTDYKGWLHPLTPYRREKPGELFRAAKAPAGRFFFTNWLGSVVAEPRGSSGNHMQAECVRGYPSRPRPPADILVAGWSMNKAKAADFVFSRAPLLDLDDDRAQVLWGMIQAAILFGDALRNAVAACLPLAAKEKLWESAQHNAVRDQFIALGQPRLEGRLRELTDVNWDRGALVEGWRRDLRDVAMPLFREIAEPLLVTNRLTPATIRVEGQTRDVRGAGTIVAAWRRLESTFSGYGPFGREAFEKLGLPIPVSKPPETKRRKAA